MDLNLVPNPLYDQPQILHVDKVATLIGENGSGKSSILQSIFNESIEQTNPQIIRTVCFSSGQNESFSKRFNEHVKQVRRRGRTMTLSSFYYDKSWAKLLIFLATTLIRDGKTREFLKEKGYAEESNDINRDDISTKLSFSFRVDKRYALRIQDALKKEESGEKGTLRQTPFYRSLESFIETLIDGEYLFEEKLSPQNIEISASDLLSVRFARINPDEDIEVDNFDDDPSISFLTQAVNSIEEESISINSFILFIYNL